MTKREAIEAMRKGKKVRHYNFSHDEWMTMNNGLLLLEDGVECTPDEFWFWRWGPEWNNGYEIVE